MKMKKSGKIYPIRGYTMLLSDALTLYSFSKEPQPTIKPKDNTDDEFGDDEIDEFA